MLPHGPSSYCSTGRVLYGTDSISTGMVTAVWSWVWLARALSTSGQSTGCAPVRQSSGTSTRMVCHAMTADVLHLQGLGHILQRLWGP